MDLPPNILEAWEVARKRLRNANIKPEEKGRFYFLGDLSVVVPADGAGGPILPWVPVRIRVSTAFPNLIPFISVEDDRIRGYDHQRLINQTICSPVESRWDFSLPPAKAMEYFLDEAQALLQSAANGTLVRPGDYYELPDFPLERNTRVVLHPGTSTDDIESIDARWGTIQYGTQGNRVAVFKWNDGQWGEPSGAWLKNHKENKLGEWSNVTGGWIYLPFEPVFPPKRPPETLGDLQKVFQKAGLNFEEILEPLLLPDGKRAWVLCLIGFPIPEKVGGPPDNVHWQALRLPIPPKKVSGFRPKKKFKGALVRGVLGAPEKLDWMTTYNVDPKQLCTRVPEGARLHGLRAVVVGCGALGSVIALELVKAGVPWIGLVDHDELEPGNVVRHVLGMDNLGQNKANSLGARLYKTNPSVEIKVLDHNALEAILIPDTATIFHEADLWIDTTGGQGVARSLGDKANELGKPLASIFITYGARHAALFLSDPKSGTSLKGVERIFKQVGEESTDSPLKAAYNDLWGEPPGEMVRTAPGCYDLTFPAAGYDISFCAAYLTKALSTALMQGGWHGLILSNPENPWDGGLRVVWNDRGHVPQ